jgi:hypothetical protein
VLIVYSILVSLAAFGLYLHNKYVTSQRDRAYEEIARIYKDGKVIEKNFQALIKRPAFAVLTDQQLNQIAMLVSNALRETKMWVN